MSALLRLAAAGLVLPLLLILGCGMVAAPQPPSLKLPEPVTDLAVYRVGNQVRLHWTMPKRDTDKVLLIGDQTAHVCRRVESGPCEVVRTVKFAPEARADFVDELPPALTSGIHKALIYTVELRNHAGRTAGSSNTAITSTGPAPAQVEDLEAHPRADGVLLSWTPAGGSETIRIQRRLVEKTPSNKSSGSPEQTLEFSGNDRGQVLDLDATLDHTYTYTVQRIVKVVLPGVSFEVAGVPSKTITIDARDVFPPAIPEALQAVSDPEAHAIDLSWQPDTEADLAGYTVYRREVGSTAPPDRISPPAQPAPSFHDANATPGHTYRYSISAVDRDGNESARSPEVEESLPAQ